MDYKQKYEEALNKAQKELQCCGDLDCDAARQIFRLFPELKESEDDVIRKDCIKYLDWEYTHCSRGEDKMKIEKCVSWLEQQGEQKSSWSVGDSAMLEETLYFINEYQKSNRCTNENDMQNSVTCENWLKSLKDKIE